MIRILILIISLLITPVLCVAQPNTPCSHENYNVVVANSTGSILYICGPSNAWVDITPSSGGLPANLIVLTLTTCPSGYSEATELNGITVIGTLAANKDVGTTGGLDNVTPAGTNTAVSAGTPSGTNSIPTFTGNASTDVVNHVHTLATGTGTTGNFSQVIGTVDTSSGGTGGTPTQTTLGTRSVATVNGVALYTPTGSVTAPTFTGSVLGTHNHTFTGTQFDNRSAFIRVIFCKKT